MKTKTKSELIKELRNIYDNKDFVCGVISNAGYERAWSIILDYIRTAKRLGEDISTDNLLLLSLDLRDDEEKHISNHRPRTSAAMF